MSNNVFVIAEIGQAHDGSLGMVHSYIDSVSKTGVDAIKFQTHIAEAESSKFETFRIKFSMQDKSRFDYWKRMEFSQKQWEEIKTHCDSVNIEFMSSPFSIAAVELLENIGINKYKIGSGEINNLLLLRKVALTEKPIILSSGMSSYKELNRTINFLNNYTNSLSILQCTTEYPTKAANIGLNVLTEMQEKYNYNIGLSDHSGEIFPSLAAVSLGAKIIEVHTVFDKQMFGPDTSSSLTIDQLKELVRGVRFIEEMQYFKVNKSDNSSFESLKNIFEKSLAVNKNLDIGHIITENDLETKKPKGYGVSASEYQNVIGRKLNKPLKKWDFLTKNDFI